MTAYSLSGERFATLISAMVEASKYVPVKRIVEHKNGRITAVYTHSADADRWIVEVFVAARTPRGEA